MKDIAQTIREQKKYIKIKSDNLLGKTITTEEQFLEAIDREIPDGLMQFYNDMPIGFVKDHVKALAPELRKNGQSWYEIYLDAITM